MKNGKFVVLDGGDGCGKDEMAKRLRTHFANRNDIIFTREPGGTNMGKKLRQILLDPNEEKFSPRTELLLFCADRAEHCAQVIYPALKRGRNIISNRFDASTAAYQFYGRERMQFFDFFADLNEFSCGGVGVVPDLYILLDVDPKVGIQRKQNNPEEILRFELMDIKFHERVRDGFLSYVKYSYPERHLIIDANRGVEEVWSDVRNAIEPLFA